MSASSTCALVVEMPTMLPCSNLLQRGLSVHLRFHSPIKLPRLETREHFSGPNSTKKSATRTRPIAANLPNHQIYSPGAMNHSMRCSLLDGWHWQHPTVYLRFLSYLSSLGTEIQTRLQQVLQYCCIVVQVISLIWPTLFIVIPSLTVNN